MNIQTAITLSAIALFSLSLPTTVSAAKPGGKGKNPGAAGKRKAGKTNGSPKQDLEPYVTQIDSLLAMDRPGGPKNTAFFDQAPGKLAILKNSYASRQAQAEGEEATSLRAAIATCNALSAALDERQKTLGQISANSAVKGSADLGRRRKDNFSEGTVGGNLTRTVDVIEQARRERAHVKETKKRAAATDRTLTEGSLNRWNQRSIELRQQIVALYGRIE